MDVKKNQTWNNHIGEQSIVPQLTFYPETIDDLKTIVLQAEAANSKVKASGSRHSWSAICPTLGYMVMPQKLTGLLSIQSEELNAYGKSQKLVKVKSGTRIRELNKLLDDKGLAIEWLGGYDGQTIAGVCQTSTHGSAIGKGPLCEMILSYDVVGSEGKYYRIEKTNGITDPASFNAHNADFTLIQDDHFYNALSVGIGCLGIIYAVTIKVVEAFYLEEHRTKITTWQEIKADLMNGSVFKDIFHYELLLNPHPTNNGKHTVLVTTRQKTNKPSTGTPISAQRRNDLVELISSANKNGFLSNIFNWFKKSSDKLIDSAIKALIDKRYINKSFKVFHIGEANEIPSYSSEIAFDMKDNHYITCIDKVLEAIEEKKKSKNLYHSAPIALRFVNSTEAYLSPMYHRHTCMVEVIMAKETKGALEMYSNIERTSYALGGRMHWGQYNYLNADRVKEMYPALDRWKEVAKVINGTGVFNNPFSNSVGLST